MKEKVEKALSEIRPSLQADGGDVEFVDIQNGIVKVRLTGACGGCPMSQMTLKQGIEQVVKKAVPEVLSVESVQCPFISELDTLECHYLVEDGHSLGRMNYGKS